MNKKNRILLSLFADVLQIYSGFGMVRQQIADGLDLAQAVDLALDYLQSGGSPCSRSTAVS